ncbi:MAG: nucleoside triphosphate pyrophosphohydrolase family protein [Comamonas sp.]|uniref:nucleoside triphosphate pyrophosphohydrolase family protein n=1 Tax=Comamonas sp. TaxID=34028 RepID=UPI002FCAA9C0
MQYATIEDLRSELGSRELGALSLNEYQECAAQTYRGPSDSNEKFEFLLLGLFGEIGSLLSELKKKQRDPNSYVSYKASSLEETGDVLWYLANAVGYCRMSLQEIACNIGIGTNLRTFNDLQPQNSLFHGPADPSHVRSGLLGLAGSVGALLRRHRTSGDNLASGLTEIFGQLVAASNDAQIDLGDAAITNLSKVLARWPIRREWGPLLDAANAPTEQLPRLMHVRFDERQVDGRWYVYQSMNGVNIGDRLTDNRAQKDDYRFHDVFHLAFAGILGWSPVLRGLLQVKRKSCPSTDENQDGARAKITEEGISNWIFSHGLRHQAFEHVESVDFDLLKTIGEMVKGYEVERLPPWAWEHAILEAFRVFRFLRLHRGGLVSVDLHNRSLRVSLLEQAT